MKKFILIVCLFTSSLQSMQKIDQRLQSELNESLFKVLYKPVVREDRRARQVLNALSRVRMLMHADPSSKIVDLRTS